MEKCVGQVSKMWAPHRKLFVLPSGQSLLRAWFHAFLRSISDNLIVRTRQMMPNRTISTFSDLLGFLYDLN